MAKSWPEFSADPAGLERATQALTGAPAQRQKQLPGEMPAAGLGEAKTLDLLAPLILGGARDLGAPGFFAHMDPPTPWITWAVSQWTASRNQNLLHPDVAPTAGPLEQQVVSWLSPFIGMPPETAGGHMTPGSTVSNLTALWAAREAGAAEVVATADAHLSVRKSAHILGMPFRIVDWDSPGPMSDAVAVITAGTTSTGAIEPLAAARDARWRHVDAAWAGPLRLSPRHAHLLNGIEHADSVSVSAHKWLFQPKESAFIFFADAESAHTSISVDGAYLATPNVGLLGSHGATAAPLAATILAYGQNGIAEWIDHTMELANELHRLIGENDDLEARTSPQSGVVNWRHRRVGADEIQAALPSDVFVSTTTIGGERWLRSVAANPNANPDGVVAGVLTAALRS